jgi:pilus assembly protein CpaC
MGRRNALVAMVCAGLMGCTARGPRIMETAETQMAESAAHDAVAAALARQQAAAGQRAARVAARNRTQLEPGEPIWIQSGKSRIIELPRPVTRVSVGNPDLAGVVILGSRTVIVTAKALPRENEEPIEMTGAPLSTGLIARERVRGPRVAETTLIFWSGDTAPDAHTLTVAGFIGEQVMLDVIVAEVNRTKLEQHGIDFRQIAEKFASAYFMGGGLGPAIPGFATTVPPIPPVPELPLSLGADRPNFVFRLPNQNITALIQFLQSNGLATIIAQPTILALSGQEALFQVGGEIPIRIVTGFVADVEFKPFGTIVQFLPRVSDEGDIILTVTPEVSQADFNSPVDGIPTFRTRRASTSAKLRDGETLVLGGLTQTVRREIIRGLPYLQDLPLVGYVFRDTRYEDEVTELVVVVTPHTVQPIPAGQTIELPTDRGPLTEEDIRTKPDPAEVTRPRVPLLP